jgi:3-phosphoshikimate 1-carboxyvinyltransferase
MAFSIAALRATGDTQIHGAEAASISFSGFFTALNCLAQR